MASKRIAEIKAQIRSLLRVAETGEQWAEICSLEAEIVSLGGSFR